ncbi:hypothetical protein KW797_04340 [Candidatus Parcubacteria bacterium]|nr:hypothetical protein [Candidatus Parcubacteria bacterium]
MTISLRRKALFVAIIAATLLSFSIVAPALAAPVSFCTDGMTVGTTSPTYMTAGKSTTTVTTSACADSAFALNGLALVEQFTGSSTASVLQMNIQDSIDGVDWYERAPNENATTSALFGFTGASVLRHTFSSTSPSMGVVDSTNSAVSYRVILIQPLLRYTRVVFSIPVGATAGGVWAKLIGWREIR